MPNDDHQRTRRCIAKTRSGSQCKNTINCSHHRCKDLVCAGQLSHTRRDIPLTPLSIRQEYLAPARSYTLIASRSLNGSGQCDTITVPPRPDGIPDQDETHHQNALPPADFWRVTEGNRTDSNDQEEASGPGNAQSGLIQHESEVTPLLDLLDSPLDDRLVGRPVLDPTFPDQNLEVGVTAKGKEKEIRYNNGQDSGCPASTSVADSRYIVPGPNSEASVTAKGKEKERGYSNGRDHNNTESHASTTVASLEVLDRSVPYGTSARDRVKARRHSNWEYYTGYPLWMSEAVYKAVICFQNSDVATDKFNTRIATLKANIDQLKAPKIQENTLDETHYNKPVSRLASLYMKTKTNTNARASLLCHLPEPPLDLQHPIPIE